MIRQVESVFKDVKMDIGLIYVLEHVLETVTEIPVCNKQETVMLGVKINFGVPLTVQNHVLLTVKEIVTLKQDFVIVAKLVFGVQNVNQHALQTVKEVFVTKKLECVKAVMVTISDFNVPKLVQLVVEKEHVINKMELVWLVVQLVTGLKHVFYVLAIVIKTSVISNKVNAVVVLITNGGEKLVKTIVQVTVNLELVTGLLEIALNVK